MPFEFRMGAAHDATVRGGAGFFGAEDRFPRDFPIFIATDANASRAYQIFDQAVEGGYFDKSTAEAKFQILAFNPELEIFALLTATVAPDPAGSLSYDVDLVLVDVNYYQTGLDYVRVILEFLLVAAGCGLVFVEVVEIGVTVEKTGSARRYVSDLKNLIDLAGYATQAVLVPLWLFVIEKSRRFDLEAKYDVHDVLATERIFKAGPDTGRAQRVFADLEALVATLAAYDFVATLGLILLVGQTLKALHFHPRYGIISKTIVNIAHSIGFWIILFGIILAIYSFLGALLFGSDYDEFADMTSACVTMLAALCGLFEYDRLPSDDAMAQIFFWSYMFLGFFVLLNVLLAIVVDGYSSTTAVRRRDPTGFFVRAFFRGTGAHPAFVPAPLLVRELKRLGAADAAPRSPTHARVWAAATRAWDDEEAFCAGVVAWRPGPDERVVAVDVLCLTVALCAAAADRAAAAAAAGGKGADAVDVSFWAAAAVNLAARYGSSTSDLDGDGETTPDEAEAIQIGRAHV